MAGRFLLAVIKMIFFIFILNNSQFRIDEIKNLYGKSGDDSIIVNTLPIQAELGLIEADFSIYNKHNNTSFWGSYIDLQNGIVKYLHRPFTSLEYTHNVLNNFILLITPLIQ